MKFIDKINEAFDFNIREEANKVQETLNEDVVNEGVDGFLGKKIHSWLQKKLEKLKAKGATAVELPEESKAKADELVGKFVNIAKAILNKAPSKDGVAAGTDTDVAGGFDANTTEMLLQLGKIISALILIGVPTAYYGISKIVDALFSFGGVGGGTAKPKTQEQPRTNLEQMKIDQEKRRADEAKRKEMLKVGGPRKWNKPPGKS